MPHTKIFTVAYSAGGRVGRVTDRGSQVAGSNPGPGSTLASSTYNHLYIAVRWSLMVETHALNH